ncbi:methyltransferase [Aureimonas endophytica]|uniref:Blue-light-activated histidine kinase n=1 Tax=Aureimonas endophytica TaxID=2027858 RepID=A0A916ZGU0_9HYPH|nr:CheR family methyltransferase [Aureimonas endophytica]GGD97017.1 methyltransferase [Aureimonas endophytica]
MDSEGRGQGSEAAEPGLTPILALGASAAATGSLERFLARLSLDEHLAAILVFQHREALDEAAFRQAVAAAGHTLVNVHEDMRIEPGRLYLSPPDVLTTIADGRLHLAPPEGEPGARGTIDNLLLSLAREEHGHAIVVMFEGTGDDGTLGFTAIKELGGLTLAEETERHRGGELETSSSPAALADFLLPPDELADRVMAYGRRLSRQREPGQSLTREVSGAMASIVTLLRQKTGHDFHGYKSGTFIRRIQRRMQVTQVEDVADYVEVLRGQPDEAQNLFNDLLIGVTQFFRDKKEFELLETQIIPRLFQDKRRDDQLRVWVIGCSTGEEAYSIAILLREHMATLDEVPQVQIFASDLDGRALASARVGRFSADIARDVPPERLARWFVKEGNTYCVVKDIREMCIFSQHSVIKDAPFSRLDLVSCRNLLIYLDAELQSRIIPLFHFALKPGGYLFLGNSENASRHANLFVPIEPRFRIFRRLDTATRILPDFPFTPTERRVGGEAASEKRHPPLEFGLSRTAERIAERYAPAFAIVDAQFNVLHFSGRAGRFIEPAGGAASLNLPNLVHPDLRLDLRMALTQAAEQNRPVQAGNLRMGTNGQSRTVRIIVEPVEETQSSSRSFVVIFKEDAEPLAADGAADGGELPRQDERVQRLEAELRVANERLQATVEELESTNEELKSSNEEYQSLNEELQSANEELETSKEELQSINEELTTVNGELAHRVQELARTNSDLKNFLESTQIATVFLDNELRVMNFTPALTEVFHLVETDIGRPIGHIKSRIAYDDLQDDVRRVLRTLGSVDREVESTTGARYMARVLPYRSVDNFIGGIVVTFTNITPLTKAQQALQESEKRLRTLTEGIPQLVWRGSSDGAWTWASMQWSLYTGLSEEESRGFGWINAVHPDDRERARRAWSDSLTSGQLEMEGRIFQAKDRTYRWFRTRAMPVFGDDGKVVEWLGTSTDIDEMRQMQERQGVLLAELQHRTRNLLGVVRAIAEKTAESSPGFTEFLLQFRERLGALSRVNALLSRLEEGRRVTFDELVHTELSARGALAEPQSRRVRLDGPAGVRLRSATVQTIALAIHELATNATKYGALAAPDGELAVNWRVETDPASQKRRLRVEWIESGVTGLPMPNAPAEGGGYGRELIERALPYQLKAETTYEIGPDGVHCTIDLPIES